MMEWVTAMRAAAEGMRLKTDNDAGTGTGTGSNTKKHIQMTIDEIIARLSSIDGMRTLAEWSAHTGIGVVRIRDAARQATADGRMTVRREKRTSLNGRAYFVMVFAFRSPEGVGDLSVEQ